mmetsp:Transcript_63356/g.150157  ORF Transcript_63356/g.150157 Transcript_63356/m.150157 type:complete len:81 (-) Transcript_63356:532-774(-)
MTAVDEDEAMKSQGGETQSVGTRSQGSTGSRSETAGGGYKVQTTWGQTVLSREAASLRTAAKSVQNAILAMVCYHGVAGC